jgi:hypothetical protein
VRFQVHTAASIKFTVLWDVTPCSHVEVDGRFRDAYCLHRPDVGGSKHFRNVRPLQDGYTMLRLPEDSKLHTHRHENLKSHSQYSDYGLVDRAIEVRSPAEAKRIFSSCLFVQAGSAAHPASCTMGIGGPFPGDKERPRRDTDD